MELKTLLHELLDRQGSDLHLVVGRPPTFRIDGKLTPRAGDALDEAAMETLLLPSLTEAQQFALLNQRQDVDLSLHEEGRTFQCHIFRERGRLGATLRPIPNSVPTLEMLGFGADSILYSLVERPRGLILVTGPTGSGKTTTCASLIERINQTRAERIITIEEPMSYEFESKQSLITQRIVGQDVDGFEQGAISALHSDLDVVFLGQMRSQETMRLALVMAETGHLVISQMHADTTSEAVRQLIDAFPEPREALRRMLARNLIAVIAQKLIVGQFPAGRRRAAANEILLATPHVREMIARGETDFQAIIEAGRDEGMQTMDDAVLKLYQEGGIAYSTARDAMNDTKRLGPAPDGQEAA